MAKWRYAIQQPTTYSGVAVIAVIWGGIYLCGGAEHQHAYQAYILTLIVLFAMTLAVVRELHSRSNMQNLQRSNQSLEQTNLLLHTALNNMPHGLCMFDRDQRLVVCNARYGEIYGLGPEQIKPGTALHSILEARVAAGVSPQDAEGYVRTRLNEVAEGNPYYAENQLSDGRIYAISHQPMRDGGWVAIHQDISEMCIRDSA